ncbi:MAG: hypothetical protein ACI9XK_004561 [Granulosicoccus sp.]|jgi:hypothetical protein
MGIVGLKRWSPTIGQPKDDMSAFLHYSGAREDEKETQIAKAWIQSYGSPDSY